MHSTIISIVLKLALIHVFFSGWYGRLECSWYTTKTTQKAYESIHPFTIETRSFTSPKVPVQPYNFVIAYMDSNRHFEVQPLAHASHSFVSTHDTNVASAKGQIFNFIWQETLKATKRAESGMKGNKLVQTLCKFHMHAYFSSKL